MSGMIHFLDINKYILSDPIGRGSFSNVYKVVDRIKGQIYAVKIYREKFDDFPDDALSPFNELSIITKLHHPSIISYIGFCMYGFQPDEYPSIFMEYAHKGSLIDFICSHKLLNDTQRLIIIYGIASAMKYLHSKNIVHADLKPANVLLDENFYPKFFCIKQRVWNSSIHCPEIINGDDINIKIDVFSFAITVTEIMNGKNAYSESSNRYMNPFRIYQGVLKGVRPEINDKVPERYQQLIEECWKQDPNARPSFELIVDQLRNDPGFITESIDKEKVDEYVNFIDTKMLEEEKNQFIEEDEEVEGEQQQQVQEEEEEIVEDDQAPLLLDVKKINLKDFLKLESIGGGFSGTVFKIQSIKEKNICAAKIIANEFYEYMKNRKPAILLTREINNLSRINHPLIMKFIGYSPKDFYKKFRPVIVTEFITNGDLESILEKERSGIIMPFLNDTHRLIIIYGIALAMSHLHSLNIIHRDLKPGNVLLDEYLFPKIADFGFSKDLSIASPKASDTMGTPNFIAPEIFEDGIYTKACDVYSFSILVYEIYMKKILFDNLNELQIIVQVPDGRRPELDDSIPICYRKLIKDCWIQDYEKRPTFDLIVKNLRENKEFITEKVDREIFYKFIKYAECQQTKPFQKYSLKKYFEELDEVEIISSGEGFINIEDFEQKEKISLEDVNEVYNVCDKKSGITYSAKTLKENIGYSSQEDEEKIAKEVGVLSKLDHPTIQKFIGYSCINFDHKRRPVIINESIPDLTLKDVLDNERKGIKNPKWNATKKLINIFGIASAMLYLHSKNIPHCDLTPKNIHLDQNLFPHVCEIGYYTKFKNLKSVSSVSFHGIKNLPIYLAPEVLMSGKHTKAGDVYSFALIVYEIVTNEVPFKNIKSFQQLLNEMRIDSKKPPFKKPIHVVYFELINRCWMHNPEKRLTFKEIVNRLKNNKDFLTNDVDENEYRAYIRMIEEKT
ncbi:hypothetical protein M9Y10_014460 [Tritrichomonas musculus]|uniref:Protein kinase domain-containing protein n=1 Tax=Tritrichomonas musculus TaxID=1915356 RepID=A0ABR2L1H4_9EUKA